MSTDLATTTAEQNLAALASIETTIIQLKQQFAVVPDAETKEGYEACRSALSQLVGTRSAVKKRGKLLREDALDWQRRVISTENRLLDAIKEVEEPIRSAKDLVDMRKEKEARDKRYAEEEAKLAEFRKKQEAAEAEAARLRAEEDARLKAERDRLEAEKAEFRKQQAARDTERAKLDEEMRWLREQKAKAEREQIEREASVQADKEAAEALERKRLAYIEAAKRKAEADKAEAARLEAIKPDIEKVHELGHALALYAETMFAGKQATSEAAQEAVGSALRTLRMVSKMLLNFTGKLP